MAQNDLTCPVVTGSDPEVTSYHRSGLENAGGGRKHTLDAFQPYITVTRRKWQCPGSVVIWK